ncbi:MAG TPA: hypothetical protein V6D05_14985, partial [Stenomitos sp.]
MLATIRTNLSAYRYRYGSYPSFTEFQRNWATPSTGQFQIIQGASQSATDVGTYGGAVREPVSSVMQVLASTSSANAGTGGYVYNATTGTIQANLDPAKFPGDNPLLW